MLTDRNYSGIQVIDMIAFLDIIEILQNPMLDSIISNMYNGPYQREIFLRKSVWYKVIEEQTYHAPGVDGIISKAFKLFGINFSFKMISNVLKIKTKVFKQLKEYLFKSDNPFAGMEDSEANVGYAFQFNVWKQALDVRYQFELVVILINTFVMLWISNSLIDDGVNIQTLILIIQDLENQPQTDETISALNYNYSQMSIYNDSYMFDYYWIFYLSMLTLAFTVKDIQELIYTKLRGMFLQFFTIETILDIFNAFITIFWIYKNYSSLDVNLNSVRPELRAWTLIYNMQIDNTFHINIIIATTMGIQLTRLVFSLQVTKTFGPMIKILGRMLVSVAIFMLLFTVLFLLFAVIGLQLFLDLDAFISITMTCITLFSACLGNFDYTIFNSATIVSPTVGYIYMTLFLIFVMILLLNLLIAILSNIYAQLNDIQIALYLRKVLYLRQKYDYDEKYSWMISAIPPLNLLAFILSPLIILNKSKTLNHIILLFEYIPVMLTAIIVFSIFSVFMIPISYGLLLFSKCSNLFNKPIIGLKDILLRITDLVIFTFLGSFIISLWVCLDILNFTLKLFDLKIIYINTSEQEYFEGINLLMDGIEQHKAMLNPDIMNRKEDIDDSLSRVKNINKALNPIKEGLSDNTLKILKACLKVVKDRHFKTLGKMDKNEFKYIPTLWVLFELKEMFMITEQINTVLFGVTYTKKENFILSDKFQEIVDSILEFEKRELRIDAEDEESESEEENIILFMPIIINSSWKSAIKSFYLINLDY